MNLNLLAFVLLLVLAACIFNFQVLVELLSYIFEQLNIYLMVIGLHYKMLFKLVTILFS
ncbi:hypothetical protein IT568_03195 [bacterium]|nr:hypothetical protein [bacterium]